MTVSPTSLRTCPESGALAANQSPPLACCCGAFCANQSCCGLIDSPRLRLEICSAQPGRQERASSDRSEHASAPLRPVRLLLLPVTQSWAYPARLGHTSV